MEKLTMTAAKVRNNSYNGRGVGGRGGERCGDKEVRGKGGRGWKDGGRSRSRGGRGFDIPLPLSIFFQKN